MTTGWAAVSVAAVLAAIRQAGRVTAGRWCLESSLKPVLHRVPIALQNDFKPHCAHHGLCGAVSHPDTYTATRLCDDLLRLRFALVSLPETSFQFGFHQVFVVLCE